MYHYLNLLLNICMLRKGPQDISYSLSLQRLSIFAYALVSYLLLQLNLTSLRALLQIGVEIALILAFSWLILSLSNKRARWVQTNCAFLGTEALLSSFAMPIVATLSINQANTLASLAMLTLMIWHWMISAHIIRHAIDQRFSFALGIAFLYIFSSYQIIGLLFPAPLIISQ